MLLEVILTQSFRMVPWNSEGLTCLCVLWYSWPFATDTQWCPS